MHLTALEEAEIIPGQDSDTRIKPLALTNDHGRYIAVTPERALASVGECPFHETAVIRPFHFRNRRAAVSELKPSLGSRSGLKNTLELLESSRYNSFSRRRRWAWL
jgi:hypothetical protein